MKNPLPAPCSRLLSLALVAAAFSLTTSLSAEPVGAYRRDVVITPLLKTQADYAGRKIVYPTSGDAEVTAVLVEIPPGSQTGWHTHPVPAFAYILEGELQLHLDGGETKTFKAGDALAEVVALLHNGINASDQPAKLVMFVMGIAGQPYAERPATTPPGASQK